MVYFWGLNMANFHIEGRQKTMDDIQRNFLFEVSIPNISSIVSTIKDEEELIIRAKTAAIPDKSILPIESYMFGMRSIYQGRVDMSTNLVVDFEETQDQKVVKTLYEWQNKIFNTSDVDFNNSGHSTFTGKRTGGTTTIFVKMYKYNGEMCDRIIKFVNAWPSTISEVGLDMAGNEAIRYSVTFTYDYWNLIAG